MRKIICVLLVLFILLFSKATRAQNPLPYYDNIHLEKKTNPFQNEDPRKITQSLIDNEPVSQSRPSSGYPTSNTDILSLYKVTLSDTLKEPDKVKPDYRYKFNMNPFYNKYQY
jgi:hypothetical protein